jgi:hypothetical protein
MHGLVPLGFLGDDFYFCLGGICGGKNGGAHDQKVSSAAHIASATRAVLAEMCELDCMVWLPLLLPCFRGQKNHADVVFKLPRGLTGRVKLQAEQKLAREKKKKTTFCFLAAPVPKVQ